MPAKAPRIKKAPTTGHPARKTKVEAEPSVITDPLVNFGGRIHESTRRRLRIYAAENNQDLQGLIEQAINEFLDRRTDH
jgi:hypothetical protein